MKAFAVVLMGCGFIAVLVDNFHWSRLREELVAKRPETTDFALGGWWWFGKYERLNALYKQEFPNGRRHAVGLFWAYAGLAAWISGGVLLMSNL